MSNPPSSGDLLSVPDPLASPAIGHRRSRSWGFSTPKRLSRTRHEMVSLEKQRSQEPLSNDGDSGDPMLGRVSTAGSSRQPSVSRSSSGEVVDSETNGSQFSLDADDVPSHSQPDGEPTQPSSPEPPDWDQLPTLKRLFGQETLDGLFNLYVRGIELLDPQSAFAQRLVQADHKTAWYWVLGFVCGRAWGSRFYFSFVVLAMMSLYFVYANVASLERLQRKYADELMTLSARKEVEEGSEIAEWFNIFVEKFWGQFEPGLSSRLRSQFNGILNRNRPNFLEDLVIKTFTLGSTAPRASSIRVYPTKSPETMTIDMDLKFASYPRSSDDPKSYRPLTILFQALFGLNVASVPIPIELTNISASGLMRFELTFYSSFPHVKQIRCSFYAPPTFEFDLQPLNAVNVMYLPVLHQYIRRRVQEMIKKFAVAPNAYTFDFTRDGIERPLGVLRVYVFEARGLKHIELLKSNCPYAQIWLGDKVVASTRDVECDGEPQWKETHYIPIYPSTFVQSNNGSDELRIDIRDYPSVSGRDGLMGTMESLKLSKWLALMEPDPSATPALPWDNVCLSEQERALLQSAWGLPDDSSPVWKALFQLTGTGLRRTDAQIRLEVSFMRASPKPTNFNDSVKLLGQIRSGILNITFHSASNLQSGALTTNPYLILTEIPESRTVYQTIVKKRTHNPVWESTFTTFTPDYTKMRYLATIYSTLDLIGDINLGVAKIDLGEIIQKGNGNVHTCELRNVSSGQLRMTVTFIPVPMNTSLAGPRVSTKRSKQPIGSISVRNLSARGLVPNKPLVDPDPFIVLEIEGRQFGRTTHILGVLSPQWKQVFEGGILYTPADVLTLTVRNWNNGNNIKHIGTVEIPMSAIFTSFDDDTTAPSEYMQRAVDDGLVIHTHRDSVVNITAPIYRKKDRILRQGVISFEVILRTTIPQEAIGYEPVSDMSEAASQQIKLVLEKWCSGIVHVRFFSGQDIGIRKTYVELYRGKKKLFSTLTQAASDPVWDQAVDIVTADVTRDVYEIVLKEQRGSIQDEKDIVAGQWKGTLAQIIGRQLQISLGSGRMLHVNLKYIPLTESPVKIEVDYDAAEVSPMSRKTSLNSLKHPLNIIGNGLEKLGNGLDKMGQQLKSIIEEGTMSHRSTDTSASAGKLSDPSGSAGRILESRSLDDIESSSINSSRHSVELEGSIGSMYPSMKRDTLFPQGSLVIQLIRCKDLPSVDISGKSDPFVRIFVDNANVFTSRTVRKNLNPSFNEEWRSEATIVHTKSAVRLEVWDASPMHLVDKLLGSVEFPWDRIPSDPHEPIEFTEVLTGKRARGTLTFKTQFLTSVERGGRSRQ
ncbi:uncharacterized protein BJ171DRAFT_522659 [Polychytrium aggregatum]|uniref:uncharacterized protein n=1 Tax=Polychytrium aggregatum TaxID=110093 RepID=UPI0022FEF339|nr:uncharacterized protein BJ171DRAFT_522659 [Polychytrium aggregatum]KAI9197111.1 hypothetical protein BJ171DRAFT_522659 [Polychytrium aggregatum]